jgi:hypothetical protein
VIRAKPKLLADLASLFLIEARVANERGDFVESDRLQDISDEHFALYDDALLRELGVFRRTKVSV